ncbi:MAG: iron chaperone, partial [Bacteroidota bacterium]
KAEEIISYNMPAFRGIVSYGGFKNHIGFFPGALAIALFKNDLTKFKTSKGTIQLPLGSRLPIGLIKKIVKFRVKEYAKKLKTKK